MDQGKYGYIDAARGVAILMVVLVHQTQAVAKAVQLDGFTALIGGYGQMGVQLFFVASAITLCMSQSRRAGQPLREFYIRRFFRIAPLYYFGIAFYFAVGLWTGQAQAYSLSNVLANVAFVHGFVPSAINDVVPGGWSIGGEMVFYAVFPFAFALADAACSRWGAAPIAWCAGLFFGLYVAAWHIIPMVTQFEIGRSNIFYYWPPAQGVVFTIGMAAFFLTKDGARPPLWVDLVGFALPTAISLVLWNSDYPAAFAIIPGCSAVAFAFLINLLSRLRFDPNRRSVIERIGEVSYSMYILHFVVVWFAAPSIITRVADVVPGGLAVLLLSYPLTVMLAFAASTVSKLIIEDVGQELGRRIIRGSRRAAVV